MCAHFFVFRSAITVPAFQVTFSDNIRVTLDLLHANLQTLICHWHKTLRMFGQL